MNHDPELTLAQAPPPELPEDLRGRLLTQARRVARWRKVERVWGFTLAAAATLLVCLNLHFGRLHEERMVALTGSPAIERPMDAKVLVQQLARRQREIVMLMTSEFPSELKEKSL